MKKWHPDYDREADTTTTTTPWEHADDLKRLQACLRPFITPEGEDTDVAAAALDPEEELAKTEGLYNEVLCTLLMIDSKIQEASALAMCVRLGLAPALRLDNLSLKENELQVLCEAISTASNNIQLLLSNLEGASVSAFLECPSTMVTRLELANINLSNIPLALVRSSPVHTLKIHHCSFSRNSIVAVINEITKREERTLCHLDLSYNDMDDETIAAVAKPLTHLSELQSLDMSHNLCGAKGSEGIHRAIVKMTVLTKLCLTGNASIGDDNMAEIVAGFCPSLVELHIAGCGVGKKTSTALSEHSQHINVHLGAPPPPPPQPEAAAAPPPPPPPQPKAPAAPPPPPPPQPKAPAAPEAPAAPPPPPQPQQEAPAAPPQPEAPAAPPPPPQPQQEAPAAPPPPQPEAAVAPQATKAKSKQRKVSRTQSAAPPSAKTSNVPRNALKTLMDMSIGSKLKADLDISVLGHVNDSPFHNVLEVARLVRQERQQWERMRAAEDDLSLSVTDEEEEHKRRVCVDEAKKYKLIFDDIQKKTMKVMSSKRWGRDKIPVFDEVPSNRVYYELCRRYSAFCFVRKGREEQQDKWLRLCGVNSNVNDNDVWENTRTLQLCIELEKSLHDPVRDYDAMLRQRFGSGEKSSCYNHANRLALLIPQKEDKNTDVGNRIENGIRNMVTRKNEFKEALEQNASYDKLGSLATEAFKLEQSLIRYVPWRPRILAELEPQVPEDVPVSSVFDLRCFLAEQSYQQCTRYRKATTHENKTVWLHEYTVPLERNIKKASTNNLVEMVFKDTSMRHTNISVALLNSTVPFSNTFANYVIERQQATAPREEDDRSLKWLLSEITLDLAHLHLKRIPHGVVHPAIIMMEKPEDTTIAVPRLPYLGPCAAYSCMTAFWGWQGMVYTVNPELEEALTEQEMGEAGDMFFLGLLCYDHINGYKRRTSFPTPEAVDALCCDEPYKEMIKGMLATSIADRWTIYKVRERIGAEPFVTELLDEWFATDASVVDRHKPTLCPLPTSEPLPVHQVLTLNGQQDVYRVCNCAAYMRYHLRREERKQQQPSADKGIDDVEDAMVEPQGLPCRYAWAVLTSEAQKTAVVENGMANSKGYPLTDGFAGNARYLFESIQAALKVANVTTEGTSVFLVRCEIDQKNMYVCAGEIKNPLAVRHRGFYAACYQNLYAVERARVFAFFNGDDVYPDMIYKCTYHAVQEQ